LKPPCKLDNQIGHRLRQIRFSRRLTLASLSQRMGLSIDRLHSYETGEITISSSHLFAASDILNVPPTDFFKGIDFAALRIPDRR